jgi:hypothetical protein
VSKERRTPAHKPVFDRLMMSTDVDGALRWSPWGLSPTGITVSRIAGSQNLQRADGVKQRVQQPARNEYAVGGINAISRRKYNKKGPKIHDTLFEGGPPPPSPLTVRKLAFVSQKCTILRSAESRIILGLGRNIAQNRV